ncbi:MAG: hypothetical protein AAGH99_09330 [Planctomycetota bacterium]
MASYRWIRVAALISLFQTPNLFFQFLVTGNGFTAVMEIHLHLSTVVRQKTEPLELLTELAKHLETSPFPLDFDRRGCLTITRDPPDPRQTGLGLRG